MRLLFDTHFVIWIAEGSRPLTAAEAAILAGPDAEFHASAASFWEMSIKHAKGKLSLSLTPPQIAIAMERLGVSHLPVTHQHANAALSAVPAAKDPFDRILLAQCQVEDMRLLTVDAELMNHPLALKL